MLIMETEHRLELEENKIDFRIYSNLIFTRF